MRFSTLLVLTGLAFQALSGYFLEEVRVLGNRELPEALIVGTAGLSVGRDVDSAGLRRALGRLTGSGSFDTVFFSRQARQDTLRLRIHVQEKKRDEVAVFGGGLATSMFGEDKFWFSLSPGYRRRFLLDRMNNLTLSVTLPYTYGLSAEYDALHFPFRTFRSGLLAAGREVPYCHSPYYSRTAFLQAFSEKEMAPRLFLRFSVSDEIGKTWRINTDDWSGLDWQIRIDPDDIRDERYSAFYPRRERVHSAAFSSRLDMRNSGLYPTSGFFAYGEGRRVWVRDLKEGSVYPYNQATGGIKAYLPFSWHQTSAAHLSATVRDHFDVCRLAHRMMVYDDDVHFRGFSALAFTNLLYLNLEHRFRFFEFRYDDYRADINLPPKMEKLARRLDYLMEIFVYVDNGLVWGDIFSDRYEKRAFSDLRLKRDLYTGAGLGGRLAYPRLGYVASGGLTVYHRKEGLDNAYMPLIYTSLTGSF